MLKQLLEQHDIPTVVLNKKDSSYLFGKIEIYVNEHQAIEAEPIIVDFENENIVDIDEN